MTEMARTTKAECPYCHSLEVHKVGQSDAPVGEHPAQEPSGPEETWKCFQCGEGFVKEPAPQ
jgi:transposase-like protein